MEEKKKDKKKWWLLLLLLLLLFWWWGNMNRVPVATVKIPNEKVANENQEPIVKCQTVVVAPRVTTELFAYTSGNKVRADYRVGAVTDKESFKTQIFYDGEWVYLWNPAMKFSNEPVVNLPGVKMKIVSFDYKVEQSSLDEVESFQDSGLSGDHLCKVWDDVDPIFELPKDIEFIESSEFATKLKSELEKICKTCEQMKTESARLTCRKNLGCQ